MHEHSIENRTEVSKLSLVFVWQQNFRLQTIICHPKSVYPDVKKHGCVGSGRTMQQPNWRRKKCPLKTAVIH
ncbi:UNVERIFIED_CONTAM: hypothetical protein NCL1_52969 [Trichonephila clavipes]